MKAMPVKRLPPMLIIGMLFFVFGFISWINAILIPYFKLCLRLSVKEAMMVAFAFYISYFVMAFPSAGLLRRTGFKNGMMLGLLVMAIGAALFIPSAYYKNYGLFLTGLFTQATGLTLLQAAANPYVTMLGPLESAAKRMSIMGVCNKLAGAIAPLILLHAVTKSPHEIDDIRHMLPVLPVAQGEALLHELLLRLRLPYTIIAILLLLLGIVIRFSGLPEARPQQQRFGEKGGFFQYPQLVLGTVAIFCGVSVEVLAVDSIINYAGYQGFAFKTASVFATVTLCCMIAGYLLGILTIPKVVSQEQALTGCGITGIFLTILTLCSSGAFSVFSVSVLGFCNALIWPSIWPIALKGLGDYTEKGTAFLIMAVAGGAITPLVFGAIAEKTNLQWAYVVLLPLYLFLCYFGIYASRTNRVLNLKKYQ